MASVDHANEDDAARRSVEGRREGPGEATETTGETIPGGLSPASALHLQRLAGNRAVAGMLSDNPFARQSDSGQPPVQRFKATLGYQKTAVSFETSGYGARMAKALDIIKDATDLELTSQDYTADATVTAKGDPGEVDNYRVGFLQTVYETNRHFYYASAKSGPGKGAKKVTDYCKTQPVRDGDTGIAPWYEVGDVKDFGKAKSSTKSTDIYDRPGTNNPWSQTFGTDKQYLVKTGGKDVFRTWIAVHNKRTKKTTWFNHNDWWVDYGTDVVVDKKSPASSKVTPTSGQGKVIPPVDGPGTKAPLLGDPTANDEADMKTTPW